MVLVRRKKVIYHDIPESLLHLQPQHTKHGFLESNGHQLSPDKDVYYIPQTGEIFLDYESYAARVSFYRMNIFMCEVTGKGNLDFYQALHSETNESTVLHARFPDQLKAAVLRAVQWQIVGRLDHLVEAVYERFKDRYFKGEKVYIDVQGDRYWARILKVFPPRNLNKLSNTASAASTPANGNSPLKLKLKLGQTANNTTDHLFPASPNGATTPGGAPPTKAFSKYRPSPSQRVAKSYPNADVHSVLAAEHATTNGDVDHALTNGHATTPLSPDQLIHILGSNLKLSLEEANRLDDPSAYFYTVQMIEEGDELNAANGMNGDVEGDDSPGAGPSSGGGGGDGKWAGSEREVTCGTMSRDRLGFNKSLLKRFLKDALDRSSAVASPWIVKSNLADRYGIETEMPPDVRAGVEGVRQGEIDKRKKVWEDKEGPPHKKQRRNGKDEEKGKVAADLERQLELELAEAERVKALPVKKKPIRYPTEDLDVRVSERDKKAGKLVRRPLPNKNLPFGDMFETFLMTWNFLTSFGKTLNLFIFSMDDYEACLRHSIAEIPCTLVSEIYVALINVVKERPSERHCAVMSLLSSEEEKVEESSNGSVQPSQDPHEKEDDWQVEIKELVATLSDIGNGWETMSLKGKDGREGWEEVLVGLLKDYATLQNFPRLRPILTHLVYGPSPPSGDGESDTGSIVEPCHPADRYPSLPPEDKLAVISFLCELAIQCRPIRTALESSEIELTELRKEKIEVNREKKKLLEEMNLSNAALKQNGDNKDVGSSGGDPDASMDVGTMSDLESDRNFDASSDVASDAGGSSRAPSTIAGNNGRSHSNHQNPTPKTIAHAKERALAREKAAGAKAALAGQRKMDEELSKLERRLEGIEREFRKMMGISRSRPLGRDRFYNRIWWFDGLGSANLLGGRDGGALYGCGRIFLQGPSDVDMEVLLGSHDQKEVLARRIEEEGEEGMLAKGEWAYYDQPEQIESMVSWLNIKGQREHSLDKTLKIWWDHVIPGMRKRLSDVTSNAKPPESTTSRRTSRAKAELNREPYMMWANKWKSGSK